MTCQVVLLNGWGVGLASDSAVTSGNRVSNGSEKIFALESPHKIAILTSKNARIMGLPWESVISAWSESLTRVLPDVNSYWESLETWICSAISSATKVTDHEYEYVENVVFTSLRKVLIDETWVPILKPFLETKLDALDFEQAGMEYWPPDLKTKVEKLVTKDITKQCIQAITAMDTYKQNSHTPALGINIGQCLVWVQRFFKEFEARNGTSYFDYLLSDFPEMPGLHEALLQYAACSLAFPDWNTSTILCVTGFGETELLPSAVKIEVLGVVGGVRLGYKPFNWTQIKDSAHLFFGQRDALDSLVSGQDTILLDASAKQAQALNQFRQELEMSADSSAVAHIKEAFENTLAKTNLEDEVISAGRKERLLPFQKAVSMSPVKDLAEFASTLVGVQSAKAAFSQDNPTVGGPIDVATITRHGGFTWIRHK